MNTNLRQARQARNLSLRAVADAVGTDAASLSRIERGLINAPVPVIRALYRFYDGAVAWGDIVNAGQRENAA